MEITFNLERFDTLVPGLGEETPEDLHEVIGTEGDRYRDGFTRACLYLVAKSPADSYGEVIAIGTEYGNTAALLGLQREAMAKGKLLSPQYFPSATSSSAAAFLSMRIGATGGNFTVNAGPLTAMIAFWQALSALHYHRSSASRLLVGDVYCPEALADAEKDAPDLACESGMTHARFTPGTQLSARFQFGPPSAGQGNRLHARRYGRNAAFAMAAFLRAAQDLTCGQSVTLESRGGEVQITRHDDPTFDIRRSTV
ncbi:hypothetical protein ACFV27_38865 [Streptomyces antimycoticus]|uniref:hypothetical protein n=1 Tax=Streptomyces antimycoticus TaxID=68175 RepID=UPI0036CEA2F3